MPLLFHCGRFVLDATHPLIMAIVNLTDDSFSGDGWRGNAAAAIAHARRQIDAGADILDLGAESSRPGAAAVSAQQEIDRLLPVIEGLRDCGIPLSIDTAKPETMRAVLAAGVDMINDITALQAPEALPLLAASRAGVCLMHMQGSPATMQRQPTYRDVVGEVAAFLTARVEAAVAAGIAAERIVVDPGFGFGKTFQHNLALLRRLGELTVELAALGRPLLVGLSRKSVLGQIVGKAENDRVYAGLAAHLWAIQRGARVLRVHDVEATRDVLTVFRTLEDD
ncbi:MAG TPA: dihydropteroate synthase [Rhodocyclaceae bacterium]|nr:dihydropteroate synthase [Rhodocyclaceae bacterium]